MDEKQRAWPFALLFVFYLGLAAVLPAVDDEYYYWCWSKDVQWSYYDHPPMTAALIRVSTWLFGDSVLAFRLPACVAATFAIYVISRLTPLKPFVWGVILTPLFTIFAVVITPDSPLILCWSAYLLWLVELQKRLTPSIPIDNPANDALPGEARLSVAWWLVGGVILGCGALGKYTMAIAVPAGFLSLLLAGAAWRRWLPGYILHGVVAFVVALPILIYNVNQNFEPILFQLRHTAERPPSSIKSFLEFVGVQMLAFGTTPFFLFPWVCYHFRRLCRDPRLRVCVCLYAFPLAFFLYKSTNARLEGNWALVSFISFWPLASEWYRSVAASGSWLGLKATTWRWLSVAGFLPPLLAVAGISIHLMWPVPVVPVKGDRVHRQIALNHAAAKVAEVIRETGEMLPVYTDTYQATSLLRFQSLDARQIAGLTRPSHFTRPPRHLTDVDRAYVVTETPLAPEFCAGFDEPTLVGSVPVIYRGITDRTMRIWLYSKHK